MKVGDLVIRNLRHPSGKRSFAYMAAKRQREELGTGIVLSKQMAGSNPRHACVTVLYPKVGRTYDIAESLLEVISEIR